MKATTLYISILAAGAMTLAGCTDDALFYEGEPADENVISYEAYAVRGAGGSPTRASENPLYEPLLLTDEGGDQMLYLHTYITDKIGMRPGEEVVDVELTRANQVTSADDLLRYQGNYKVLANISNSETYFGWTDARNNNSDHNIWQTDRTEYWPGEKTLAFYAVSPSSEFSNLKGLNADNGRISFSYSLPKGDAGNDAEVQSDLLLASSFCNKKGSVNGRVPLNFHHALSAVKFAIRDVANGEIESISISGVKSKGECVLDYNADESTHSVSWFGQSGSDLFSQKFNYKISGLGAVDPSDENSDILLSDKMPEKTFMMIPQIIPDDAEIIVSLKRTGMTPERIELRGRIKDNLISEWKPGHEYVYTISTTKSNWIYVLEAFGNHNSSTGKHDVAKGDQIYGYSPSYAVLDEAGRVKEYPHDTYGDNAYFSVRSYRYHANDPKKIENLSWSASHMGGEQYRVYDGQEELYPYRKLTPEEWIPTRDALKGEGSSAAGGERKNISFATHQQITDWPGDSWMQDQKPYSGNSESKPWDLSTGGGALSRNTANCYIVDREGWYCFPMVYGNAIKNGKTNANAYTYQGSNGNTLKNMLDHAGNAISDPWISDAYCKSADVVWTDVYNAVSDVKLTTIDGRKFVVFKANKYNIQQGSAVIALYNGNTVVWSWHIWLTEHWIDTSTGQPNAFKSDGSFSKWEAAEKSGWRQRGDLAINNQYVGSSYGYYIAPYNLGWCDPKNVDYLRRRSDMVFTQFTPDGKPTGKTATLPVIQDGERVSYKFGNNTYYQWGRKDPIVGFVDHSQTVKRNFGNKKYELKENASGVTIPTAIKNPHAMYYGGDDWSKTQYLNLWNNGSDQTTVVKTVYDPCPPGYSLPPAKMYEFIGPDNNNLFDNGGSDNKTLKNFNGKQVDNYTFKACVRNIKNVTQTDNNSVWLTSTGNRWYTNGSILNGSVFNGGDNFNAQIVYLWSATSRTGSNAYKNSNSLALGLDKFDDKGNNQYVICSYFIGRKTMARPVRPIREQ